MSKSVRKACSSIRVDPFDLWKMFTDKLAEGDRYELGRLLGKKFEKDISKVEFNFENFTYSHFDESLCEPSGLVGIRQVYVGGAYGINYCMPFIGCFAGGDWEWPVWFIVYLDADGKTFRGYIPKLGNPWNYDTKQAFGNNDEADKKFLLKWCKKNKPDIELSGDFEVSDAEIMDDPRRIVYEIKQRFIAV